MSHRLVATALAVAVLAAGCSGSDDDGDADAGATTTTSAATSTTTAPATTTTAVLPASPAEVPVPASAAQVGDALLRTERGLRRDGVPDDEAARLGWEQQLAYSVLISNPPWQEEALGALEPDVAAIARANLEAGAQLRTLAEPQPDLPEWRIREPAPVSELLAHYEEAQRASGVPWPYLAAIHFVETRMGRIVGVSTAGAQGPMQFIPETWAAFGEGDVYDDRDAILAAGRYLASRGAPADMGRALYSYNNSDRYVTAVSNYAHVIAEDPRAYLGYYHWQVYYGTMTGRYLLPVGYGDGVDAVRVDAIDDPS